MALQSIPVSSPLHAKARALAKRIFLSPDPFDCRLAPGRPLLMALAVEVPLEFEDEREWQLLEREGCTVGGISIMVAKQTWVAVSTARVIHTSDSQVTNQGIREAGFEPFTPVIIAANSGEWAVKFNSDWWGILAGDPEHVKRISSLLPYFSLDLAGEFEDDLAIAGIDAEFRACTALDWRRSD